MIQITIVRKRPTLLRSEVGELCEMRSNNTSNQRRFHTLTKVKSSYLVEAINLKTAVRTVTSRYWFSMTTSGRTMMRTVWEGRRHVQVIAAIDDAKRSAKSPPCRLWDQAATEQLQVPMPLEIEEYHDKESRPIASGRGGWDWKASAH